MFLRPHFRLMPTPLSSFRQVSVSLAPTFEGYFLQAYALSDSTLTEHGPGAVIEILEKALKCPSDGLRKGQALNNLGR